MGRIQSDLCIFALAAPEAENSPLPAIEVLRRQLVFDARVEWRSAALAKEILAYLASHDRSVLVWISVATHEEAVQAVLFLKLLANSGAPERCAAIALLKTPYAALEPSLRMHGCREVLIDLEDSPDLAETAFRCMERFEDEKAVQRVERSDNARGLAAFLLSEWMNRAHVERGFRERICKLLN